MTLPSASTADGLVEKNSKFYESFWAKTYLTRPERFNTWPMISALLPAATERLEIGPGLRPRLPIGGTHFIDLSPVAVKCLNTDGGKAQSGEITALPFANERFDLVAAFDVVEHVEDDARVFAELTRVLKVGGHLLFSVPLHSARWTVFDDYVGHARRYEPDGLKAMIARCGLVVQKSVPYGMQSNNPRLLRYAVDGLTRHHAIAVRCYNWIFFPLGMLMQERLKFREGLMDLTCVSEILLVCRKGGYQVK